jgi:predicted O-methyltransferase YrrM
MSYIAKQSILRLLNTFGIESQQPTTDTVLNAIKKVLTPLDPHFRTPLLSMYCGEPQLGTDGKLHDIDKLTRFDPSQGMWLYDLCVSVKPKATIEIGMAYGYSTIYFLAAVAKNQLGCHTAIDPFQRSAWQSVGLTHAQSLAPQQGSEPTFQLIEDRSDRAAIDLTRSNSTFDVIFIDGNHRFDDVLVDFYLYAPLCAIGGYIIFDDMWMSSIQTVVSYVRANRTDFVEIRDTHFNICVFQKVGDDTRQWNHFRKFSVSQGFRSAIASKLRTYLAN